MLHLQKKKSRSEGVQIQKKKKKNEKVKDIQVDRGGTYSSEPLAGFRKAEN